MGTPFRGAGSITWAKTAVNCAKALTFDSHDGLLDILDDESRCLRNLKNDFIRVALNKISK